MITHTTSYDLEVADRMIPLLQRIWRDLQPLLHELAEKQADLAQLRDQSGPRKREYFVAEGDLQREITWKERTIRELENELAHLDVEWDEERRQLLIPTISERNEAAWFIFDGKEAIQFWCVEGERNVKKPVNRPRYGGRR